VTYSGPSKGLQAYATKVYAQAGMGQPPVANAPEVREGRKCWPHLRNTLVHEQRNRGVFILFLSFSISFFFFISSVLSLLPLTFSFSLSFLLYLINLDRCSSSCVTP
jgi:hypothetical protein